MPNTNCLEGMACPDCGSERQLLIRAEATFRVTDAGSDTFTDMDWDDESNCSCPTCGHIGQIKNFRIVNQEKPPHHLEDAVEEIHSAYRAGNIDEKERNRLLKDIRTTLITEGIQENAKTKHV